MAVYWTILIACNLPLYWIVSKVFFSNLDDLGEAIGYWFTPDLWSAASGHFWDDWWAEMKLGVWVALCVGATMLEHNFIQERFMSGG